MDATEFTAGSSEQLNAADVVGVVVITVTAVTPGPDKKQPLNIATDVYGADKPFRPALTVRRELLDAWGKETDLWVGRRMAIYNQKSVIWGGKEVGGIRLQALSDIDGPMEHDERLSRTKMQRVLIQPLPPIAKRDWAADIQAADLPTLKAMWTEAPPQYQDAMKARAAEITNTEGAE